VTGSPSAIPVWVVTGPLGCGKTTLLARLLAGKPAAENWVVLLNEFTDAGIDTLTVAAAARGAFDVRLVPGGCLCCAGEADFRRNLQQLVDELRPDRILVEPSGIGHPGGIVDELLAHQAAGSLKLEAVIGLLGPHDLARVTDEETVRAVVEIADVLLMSKADLADAGHQQQFWQLVTGSFPPKRAAACIERGEIDDELRQILAGGAVELPIGYDGRIPSRPTAHADQLRHAAHHHDIATDGVMVGDGERRVFSVLGRAGVRWSFPRSVSFAESRLMAALLAEHALSKSIERLKAVLRVGEDDWLLLQRVGDQLHMQPTAWRRDNRIELQGREGAELDVEAWENLWSRCRAVLR